MRRRQGCSVSLSRRHFYRADEVIGERCPTAVQQTKGATISNSAIFKQFAPRVGGRSDPPVTPWPCENAVLLP